MSKGRLRSSAHVIAAALGLVAVASAAVSVTDTGYRESGAHMRRTFTIDTGKREFVLQTNGSALGWRNASWHSGELCVVEANGESFFAFDASAGRKKGFKERTVFKTLRGPGLVRLEASQKGARATVTVAITARENDDKLELTIRVRPKGLLYATLVKFECYPSTHGPRHQVRRAVATPKREVALKSWENEKRVVFQKDEPWVFFFDKRFDLGVPIGGGQKARGGCALFYSPGEAREAWVKMGAHHMDPRFRFGPGVKEMHFALLDFWGKKTNAQAVAQLRALGATGYRVGDGKATARETETAQRPQAASVKPAPTVIRRRSSLLPDGALPLVVNGKTRYVIYHDPSAPSSVKEGARELQRVIGISTGATLRIVDKPTSPMICLGDGPGAIEAGVSGKALPYETFRLRTVGEDLYIVGRDTADDERTPLDGVSRGTQFGVYAFLERVVGARWIMPGDIGEEIPKRKSLTVPKLNIEDGPDFAYRMVATPDPPVVKLWGLRNRVGTGYGAQASSLIVNASHSWRMFMPKWLREGHPEWDAVDGEVNKFCTRRPDAVRAFAENVVFWIDQHPDRLMVSAAPSDGQAFCRCAQCRRFIARDAHGKDSVTLNMLDFYNDVARYVARKRPGHMVGGFAYGLCTYPPAAPIVLEPNVFIQWTPLNYYGMGLYKPGYRDEFERVAAAWRALTPNVSYWNYCHWHRSGSGAPYGPALPIMKMQFPALKKHGYRGIREDATSSWAYGGPNNYLLAKLMWNADADVDALFDEWLRIGYGRGADAMKRLYAVLDEGFRDFKVNHESFDYHGDNYEIMGDKLETIYAPRLARLEALYREALAAVREERPRKRLTLFGMSMTVFHYNLRKAGYLKTPEKSAFYKSDVDYNAFMSQSGEKVFGRDAQWLLRPLRAAEPIRPRSARTAFRRERRALAIPRLRKGAAITVDGRIDPAEWRGAAVAGRFRVVGGLTPAKPATAGRLLHDGRTLYIALECADSRMAEASDRRYPRDSMRIYTGNTAEVFLDFTGKPNKFWHLTVNPANSQWDGIGASRSANLEWRSAVGKSRNGWTVEMAVPFSGLGVTDPARKRCRANLARTRMLRGDRVNSAWNAVKKSFLEPVSFGEWRFAAE